MYKVKETIVVEGDYDKIRLSGFIDGIILTTHGFAVFTNKDFIETIRFFAKKTGIVILTDGDSAGMKIRAFVKQKAAGGTVRHAYIPDISGKERRKRKYSAEGLLGVEGMSEEIIIKALKDAGCTIDNTRYIREESGITKTDLYLLGLSGAKGSRQLRDALSRRLGVPARISANMLTELLNRLVSKEELSKLVDDCKKCTKND